jgi:hypothetical protein
MSFSGALYCRHQQPAKIRAEKRMGTPICQGEGGFVQIPGGIALEIA